MHVMHIIDSMHGGGAESSILEVTPELSKMGIRTSIVTLLPDDGGLEDRLGSIEVRRTRLSCKNPINAIRELRRIIRAENPDLLHTSLMFSNLACRIAALGTSTPVVTTLANLEYGPEHRADSSYGAWAVRAAQFAELTTAPLTSRFHAVSHDVAKVMSRRLRIPRDRIEVIYRGRDPARLGVLSRERRLRVRSALSLDANVPVILSVGRLDRQKGVDITLEAFRSLTTGVPDAVLLVAGRPGNASAEIEASASRTPGVRLLGHRTDIPDLMCAADVLSFPSRWEGLGGTLIEAMALRLPVVASNITPIAEVIDEVGWPLVQVDDPSGLADCLSSLLKNDPDNEARKEAGLNRFLKLFTAVSAAQGMAEFYRSVLHDYGGRK
jgi:glycosyltransferase involved in cell wall biosynthesis